MKQKTTNRKTLTAAKRKKLQNSQFSQEVTAEIKRITWPNRDLVVKASVLVLGIVIVTTVMIGFVDAALVKFFMQLNQIIK